MLDIRLIRDNPEIVQNALRNRNYPKEAIKAFEEIIELDLRWRNVKKEEEELRAQRNALSISINDKKKAGESADDEIRKSTDISRRVKDIAVETEQLDAKEMHCFCSFLQYLTNPFLSAGMRLRTKG